jgi:5-methylcytosine-specific restriction endonuclease McrA
MIVYRKKQQIPVIYAELPFVRCYLNCQLADSIEDIPNLTALKDVASGGACPSSLETSDHFVVKCGLPDDLLTRTGATNELITWSQYTWKLWDVQALFSHVQPAEAMRIEDAGIDERLLRTIVQPTSCIPLLQNAEIMLTNGRYKGFRLTDDLRRNILELEERLFARLAIDELKGHRPKRIGLATRTKCTSPVSPKLRESILRRDHYRCIFCGQNADSGPLEVNHILPRSIILKLHLRETLLTDIENLCATCFPCNRGKSDHLSQEDIDFYISRFSDTGHPNHGVVPYLKQIAQLQNTSQTGSVAI